MSVNNHGGPEGPLRELCTRVQYFELLLCIYAQELSKPGQSVSSEKIQGSILRASQEILYLISDIGDPIVASEWYAQTEPQPIDPLPGNRDIWQLILGQGTCTNRHYGVLLFSKLVKDSQGKVRVTQIHGGSLGILGASLNGSELSS